MTPENSYRGIPFTPENVAAASAGLRQLEDRWALYRTPMVEVAPPPPSPKVPAADAVYDPVRCVWSDGTTDEQFERAPR